jgi:site-specific DNA-cytosine methylase
LKVLSINTYGGSLLLAAKLAKMEVVASLEDCGFGSDIQALNFPDVPLIRDIKDWPAKLPGGQKWKDTIVIAHPPCAAFSTQNSKPSDARTQGTGAASFQCHVNVMNYALGAGCAALAIESVPGAIAAKSIYEEHAAKYGYKAFFVSQNAVSFGVPQWRPRIWTWFMKKRSIGVELRPKYKTLGDLVKQDGAPVSIPPSLTPIVEHGLRSIDNSVDELRGAFFNVLEKNSVYKVGNKKEWVKSVSGTARTCFGTDFPIYYGPEDFSGVILHASLFYTHGKPLTDKDMCRIMGFPPNYKWGKRAKQYRMYLSKGICPPVGAWVLQQLRANLEGPVPTQYTLKPGEILDLCPKRKDALAAVRKGRS